MELDKIVKNIKKIRELRDYDQRYMASQLNISQAHYSRIEKGVVSTIGVHVLAKIAVVLQVSIEVLFTFDVDTFLQAMCQSKQEEKRVEQKQTNTLPHYTIKKEENGAYAIQEVAINDHYCYNATLQKAA